ncbi:MAG: phosphopantothenoylcysteine decarboxylase, partial [Bacteroidales bacterium]|nr:phosphopantothenoylcysteine decarboxylase [Bacteroidales bacterium]
MGKHIVIGISGGIAAYKTLTLIRLFKKNGYEVRVTATRNALQFVTPLT